MKSIYKFLFAIFIISINTSAFCADVVTFESTDGVKITAQPYMLSDAANAPIIVLFHQAGWSRGEYLEIAPKLNELGFNCIAVDQRSGDQINGVKNETAANARAAGKETRYIDALPDMIAILKSVNNTYPDNKVIAWGSSYSASLVLHIAGTYPDLVDGVLSFAPGEYFAKQGKSNSWIKDSASSITIPVFITSARNEKKNWSAIYDAIPSANKTAFVPQSKGNHGSRALWEEFSDHGDYWDETSAFLEIHFPH